MSTRALRLAPIVFAVGLDPCSGGAHSTLPPQQFTPQSVSPASIPAAPMAHTAILPSSAMRPPDKPNALALQGLHYTQLPGSASEIAAAPDGTLWALSTEPSGPDKYIWHYSNRIWTNISGLAQHIAATAPAASAGSPTGNQIYAINSGGGVYGYNGTSWTALGGGAAAVTAGLDGSVYVTSNGGSSADRAIWKYNGSWSQVPGSGVTLAGSWGSECAILDRRRVRRQQYFERQPLRFKLRRQYLVQQFIRCDFRANVRLGVSNRANDQQRPIRSELPCQCEW